MQLPVFDVGSFRAGGEPRAAFVRELGRAFRELGFASVIGHGIAWSTIERAYEVSQRFFALSTEEKLRYHVPGGGGARGYTPFRVETARDQIDPDLKEFWHVGRELPERERVAYGLPPNLWPAQIPDFRPALLSLYAGLDALGVELLSAIALDLGLGGEFFANKIDHGNSILRPLHYPPLTSSSCPGVRSAPHEDINLITLMVSSGEPGLEIRRRDGSWVPIDAPHGHVIVNIGDMLQRLTNHVLPSTTHRVVNPQEPRAAKARYSIPFFLHFNGEVVIETLRSCVTPDRPNRYPEAITADAYLRERLREIGLLA